MAESNPGVPTIWRRKKVEAETGLARSTIYALMKEKKFPGPISLGSRSVGWIRQEVLDWINRRIDESRRADRARPQETQSSTP